jgi:hypothetical protein
VGRKSTIADPGAPEMERPTLEMGQEPPFVTVMSYITPKPPLPMGQEPERGVATTLAVQLGPTASAIK